MTSTLSLALLVALHEVHVVDEFSQVRQGEVQLIVEAIQTATPLSVKPVPHKHYEEDSIKTLKWLVESQLVQLDDEELHVKQV